MEKEKAKTKTTHKAHSSKSGGTYGANESLAILIEENFLMREFKKCSRYIVSSEFLWVAVVTADIHDILWLEVKHILQVFTYERNAIAANSQVVHLQPLNIYNNWLQLLHCEHCRQTSSVAGG